MTAMTEQDKEYMERLVKSVVTELKADFTILKEVLTSKIAGIEENVKVKLESINSNQKTFRDNQIDIFNKINNINQEKVEMHTEIKNIDKRVCEHISNHAQSDGAKRANTSIVVSIIVGIFAIAGFFYKLFGG